MQEKSDSIFSDTVRAIARYSHYLGSCILAIMVLFVTAGVVMRYFFNRPIIGDFELVQLMLGLMLALALAKTSVDKGHVKVELLISQLPPRLKHAVDSMTNLCCMIFLGLMIWQNILYVVEAVHDMEITQSLFLPFYPFIAILALSLILFWFALLVDFIESISKVVKK